MTHALPIRRFLIGAAAFAILASQPVAAQLTVHDPTNYTQNLLQAARALTLVNNQIISLQNEAQSLMNEARNLTSLPTNQLREIQQSMDRIRQLIGEAKQIAYEAKDIDRVFDARYPQGSLAGTAQGKRAAGTTLSRSTATSPPRGGSPSSPSAPPAATGGAPTAPLPPGAPGDGGGAGAARATSQPAAPAPATGSGSSLGSGGGSDIEALEGGDAAAADPSPATGGDIPPASGSAPAPAAGTSAPAWARRLRRQQMITQGATLAAHSLRSADHGGGATHVSLEDRS